MSEIRHALAAGYASMAAWSELIDRINVFPVADGDTGANLRISLSPLRQTDNNKNENKKDLAEQLRRAAIGNSGNIAAAFFLPFTKAKRPEQLAEMAALGRDRAREAVAEPRPGAMLDVLGALADALARNETDYSPLEKAMRQAVISGMDLLPALTQAGVVDAGALAMYIFFSGFFQKITGKKQIRIEPLRYFSGRLSPRDHPEYREQDRFCIDATLRIEATESNLAEIRQFGASVVVQPLDDRLKIHIHTQDQQQLKTRLAGLGKITNWREEPIDRQQTARLNQRHRQALHLLTDAAGSLPKNLADQYGISLLDSFIVHDQQARPESLCRQEEIYRLLREGARVSTAQASIFEQQQIYAGMLQRFDRCLYLCVGSAFTGNFSTVTAWKAEHDPENRLHVIDTGAASGRLGLIALQVARFAEKNDDPQRIITFAEQCCRNTCEYICIDTLKYLVAGGRLSTTRGFFGNLIHSKPIISPRPEGVHTAAMRHSRMGQLTFVLEQLEKTGNPPVILLEYSDNQLWVKDEVLPEIRQLRPSAEILTVPLSLTSGVHMGPGSWGATWSS